MPDQDPPDAPPGPPAPPKPKHPGGRRSKLTPELQASLCEKISAIGGSDDLFFADACRISGVHVSTALRWMAKGREQTRGKFREFYEAVELARTQSFVGPLAQLRQHGRRNPRALEAWLRIAHPRRANPQVSVHVTAELDGALDRLAVGLKDQPEVYEQVLRLMLPESSLAPVQPAGGQVIDGELVDSDRSESSDAVRPGAVSVAPGQGAENTEG